MFRFTFILYMSFSIILIGCGTPTYKDKESGISTKSLVGLWRDVNNGNNRIHLQENSMFDNTGYGSVNEYGRWYFDETSSILTVDVERVGIRQQSIYDNPKSKERNYRMKYKVKFKNWHLVLTSLDLNKIGQSSYYRD